MWRETALHSPATPRETSPNPSAQWDPSGPISLGAIGPKDPAPDDRGKLGMKSRRAARELAPSQQLTGREELSESPIYQASYHLQAVANEGHKAHFLLTSKFAGGSVRPFPSVHGVELEEER